MILVELALQGLKGFPELVRLPLKPGLNVARPSDRALGAAIFDAYYHTLFPDPSRGNATAHLVASRAARSRMALTFYGRDRVTYRLIREADSGATKLYKFDVDTQQYKLFTKSASEAAQYVRVQQRLPDEVSYERLFVFAPESMPSRGQRARTRSGAPLASGLDVPAPSGPGLPMQRYMSGVMPRPESTHGRVAPPRGLTQMPTLLPRDPSVAAGFGSSFNPTNALVQSEIDERGMREPEGAAEPTEEEKRDELERLRLEVETLQRSERAQDEIDQLAARRFELAEKLDKVTKLRAELTRLDTMVRDSQDLDGLPDGFSERLRHFEELGARYTDDRARLTEEINALEAAQQTSMVQPLKSDPYFLAGVVGAVAFLFIAWWVSAPVLALVNIACAVVAAGAGFRWVSDLEAEDKERFRLQAASDRLERLERQHNLDTGATRRLMKRMQIDTPAELLSRVEDYEQLRRQRATLQEALHAGQEGHDLGESSRELEAIQSRISSLEADLAAGSGTVLSADTLNRRIRRLEADLGEGAQDTMPLEAQPQEREPSGPSPRPASPRPASQRPASQRPASPRPASPRPASQRPERTASVVTGTPMPGRPSEPSDQPARSPSVVTGTPVPAGGGRAPSGGTHPSAPPRVASVIEGTPLPSDVPGLVGARRLRDPPEGDSQRLPTFPGPATGDGPGSDDVSFSRMKSPATSGSVPEAPYERRPPDPLPPPVAPVEANREEEGWFDYGGGIIGSDDEEEEEGYGSGYGRSEGSTPSSGRGRGSSTAPAGMYAVGQGGGGGGLGGYEHGGYSDDGGGQYPDRSRDLMQAAVDILQMEIDELGRNVASRMGQYLAAFTDGTFVQPEFGPRGEVAVRPKEGDPIAYVSLPDDQVDLVDSAIRFCLVEAIVARHRLPVLFDDPFTGFPPKRRKLFSQMLAYLGANTQLLVMTPSEDIEGDRLEW